MIPERKTHREVEIRYGYAISDDKYHAHFDLPAEREAPFQLQRAVLTRIPAARPKPGKGHVQGVDLAQVLSNACDEIDRYLDGSG